MRSLPTNLLSENRIIATSYVSHVPALLHTSAHEWPFLSQLVGNSFSPDTCRHTVSASLLLDANHAILCVIDSTAVSTYLEHRRNFSCMVLLVSGLLFCAIEWLMFMGHFM